MAIAPPRAFGTREFLAKQNNRNGGVPHPPNDIIFFNGLGGHHQGIRVSSEHRPRDHPVTHLHTHSASKPPTPARPGSAIPDPHNHWYPDIGKLLRRVKYNPSVAGILIINPDNPTGAVYPEAVLREIVAIAREHDLFIIADEIYQNLIYNDQKTKPLADVIGDVPGLAMKGISKELPWPGSRCGWIEVYNADKDPLFAKYIQSILNAKMVEVCSTTLPQKAIPQIFQHPEYQAYLEDRRRRYEKFSNLAYDQLKQIPGVVANRTNGAFYMSVAFEEELLNQRQTLSIPNPEARALVEELTSDPNIQPDKRFVYYLLAATGICVVPLSSFNTELQGFRMTLLEPDETEFRTIIDRLERNIRTYLES
jgi:aspartate/methionine/tyrosine aminotransferase